MNDVKRIEELLIQLKEEKGQTLPLKKEIVSLINTISPSLLYPNSILPNGVRISCQSCLDTNSTYDGFLYFEKSVDGSEYCQKHCPYTDECEDSVHCYNCEARTEPQWVDIASVDEILGGIVLYLQEEVAVLKEKNCRRNQLIKALRRGNK